MNLDTILKFCDDISKDPTLIFIISIVSLALTIGSIILACYFYLKSKKNKKPKYILKSVNLVEKNHKAYNDLNISYKGQEVENVTSTKLAFWNAGKETIRASDISTVEPLAIKVQNGEILDVIILGESKVSNHFSIKVSDDFKLAFIDFEYLDFNEGVVFQVIHSGTKSSDISICGSIAGVKNILLVVEGVCRFFKTRIS